VLLPALVGGLVREMFAAQTRADNEALARRAEEEHLRSAREVHDAVGHGLSVISLQAGAALQGLQENPEQAQPALEAIQTASNAALDELRVTLDPGPDASPSPGGLDRLGAILEQVRLAGLAVEVHTVGNARALSPDVDLAALRVVQESLSNVLRHAGSASAWVELRYEPRAIVVEVTDDGAGTGGDIATDARRGLEGLRWRAQELGGNLEVGWAPDRGWQVTAVLPTDARPRGLG